MKVPDSLVKQGDVRLLQKIILSCELPDVTTVVFSCQLDVMSGVLKRNPSDNDCSMHGQKAEYESLYCAGKEDLMSDKRSCYIAGVFPGTGRPFIG